MAVKGFSLTDAPLCPAVPASVGAPTPYGNADRPVGGRRWSTLPQGRHRHRDGQRGSPGAGAALAKDRLARLGFDFLEHVAVRSGCEIIVANQEALSPQQELVEDLFAVVHSFSCRLDGLRRYDEELKRGGPGCGRWSVKVTRIAYSTGLNPGKYGVLVEQARRLGRVRSEVWQRYGSIYGVGSGLKDRQVRDRWLADGTHVRFGVLANAWKETVRDAIGDIAANREAAKVQVRRAIARRTNDSVELKRMFTALKADRWAADPFLARQMRQHWKRGKNAHMITPCLQ
ncbi:IS607 family transposase [Micromonospora sp. SL4-19]|uniref:IS607 family transposase n=1 Tax=Micromonospora sp. SL4-19 TaxID=3399129 RepID=UPI003A4DBDC4